MRLHPIYKYVGNELTKKMGQNKSSGDRKGKQIYERINGRTTCRQLQQLGVTLQSMEEYKRSK